jgi:L,D-transpeptidase catalytic domain
MWARLGRALTALVLLSVLLVPVTAAADQQPTWVVTLNPVRAYSAPSPTAVDFGTMPGLTTLQLLDYQGDFAHVVDPRSKTVAYVPSEQLGPGDPPSPWVFKPAPKLTDEFSAPGVLTDSAPMALYPTSADDAVERQLYANAWLTFTGQVNADDGSTWYRTDNGDYVPADAVFIPARADTFTGHWLDVNLNAPARVTAYEADEPVNSFLTIIGAGPRPTPTGVFTILRRVANETMNSDTIGIPRFGPGGYYLTNVLFTQYFTGDGASLHYNYWSSNWGYAGSHGCLGLTYRDSAWLWDWAHMGTPVMIHR